LSRNTTTGAVLEQMVLPALQMGGYHYETQASVGERFGGGTHKVDVLAFDKRQNAKFLVSLKWQQSSGTAEQKVPFEIMCLAHALAVSPQSFSKAYLVLGGDGWKLRDFYISGGLNTYLKNIDAVKVMSLEAFVALANQGNL